MILAGGSIVHNQSHAVAGYYRFQNMTTCERAPPGMYMDDNRSDLGNGTFNATHGSIRRRSLLYLVGNMRRWLQQQASNVTAAESLFPVRACLFVNTPGIACMIACRHPKACVTSLNSQPLRPNTQHRFLASC